MNVELLDLREPVTPVRPDRSVSPLTDSPAGSPLEAYTASLRVPVRRTNREYLRALRAAELAAWQQAGQRPAPRRTITGRSRHRLPTPADVRGQGWEAALHGVLLIGSIAAAVGNLAAGLALVTHWHLLTAVVRAALT